MLARVFFTPLPATVASSPLLVLLASFGICSHLRCSGFFHALCTHSPLHLPPIHSIYCHTHVHSIARNLQVMLVSFRRNSAVIASAFDVLTSPQVAALFLFSFQPSARAILRTFVPHTHVCKPPSPFS